MNIVKVRVTSKKYCYAGRVYKQGSLINWDTDKHRLCVSEVEAVGEDASPQGKVVKLPDPTTLHEMAKKSGPIVNKPQKGK